MSLVHAAETMLGELTGLAARERNLRDDLDAVGQRRADLTEALQALVRTLPAEQAQPVLHALAALGPGDPAHGRPSNMSARSEAAHDFIARWDGIIKAPVLQSHLEGLGLAPRPNVAAILLARKVDQGVVTRIGHGRYRANLTHPEIARRRAYLA